MDAPKYTLFHTYVAGLRLTSLDEETEHTDRTHFENFMHPIIKNMDSDINIIHEPKRDKDGFGAPDFRIKKGETQKNSLPWVDSSSFLKNKD